MNPWRIHFSRNDGLVAYHFLQTYFDKSKPQRDDDPETCYSLVVNRRHHSVRGHTIQIIMLSHVYNILYIRIDSSVRTFIIFFAQKYTLQLLHLVFLAVSNSKAKSYIHAHHNSFLRILIRAG
jgi:hypothetical protein